MNRKFQSRLQTSAKVLQQKSNVNLATSLHNYLAVCRTTLAQCFEIGPSYQSIFSQMDRLLFWLCVMVCFGILHGTRFLIQFVAKIGKDKIHLRDESLLMGVRKICVERIFHQAIRLKVFACPTFILLHNGCKTRHAELLKNLRVNKTSVYLLLRLHFQYIYNTLMQSHLLIQLFSPTEGPFRFRLSKQRAEVFLALL